MRATIPIISRGRWRASWRQDQRPADQVVLVEDGAALARGPHRHIVDAARKPINPTLEVVALAGEPGADVAALNAGLGHHCRGEYVFRMDADDICVPGRFKAQLAYMEANTDVGVLGSAMAEFSEDPASRTRSNECRPPRRDHTGAAVSQSINHPTVCMRRAIIRRKRLSGSSLCRGLLPVGASSPASGVRFQTSRSPARLSIQRSDTRPPFRVGQLP
ncbi:MAG: glycosyltransferase [Gammaproteobacteria bacterium]|nr:glycosyltransferase [Gammaproteobacteria bacterium]